MILAEKTLVFKGVNVLEVVKLNTDLSLDCRKHDWIIKLVYAVKYLKPRFFPKNPEMFGSFLLDTMFWHRCLDFQQ